MGYDGPVRVSDEVGIMLSTGEAVLEDGTDTGSWRGTLRTLAGDAIAGKALVVELATIDGRTGRAQLIPRGVDGDRAVSDVIGLGSPPF